MQDTTPAPTWEKYRRRFREDVHQLLAWGYADSRHQITSDCDEPTITALIRNAIQARLSAGVSVTPKRFNYYCVKLEDPIPDKNRRGRSLRRLDIVFEMTSQRPRPHYIFEAKRLHRRNHLINDYMGEDGLLRFVDSIYGVGCPEAAMLGFIQSDNSQYWEQKLRQAFAINTENKLRIKKDLRKKIVITSLPNEWTSQHERYNQLPITMLHIFLDCLTITSH